MSLATAAEYALMLTDPGSPQPAAPVPGALSARERELVTLVARGRTENAAAHLREALQTAVRTGSRLSVFNDLDCCGDLCAATGRRAEAVTIWAAEAALSRHEGYREPPAGERLRRERLREAWQAGSRLSCARPRSAARR